MQIPGSLDRLTPPQGDSIFWQLYPRVESLTPTQNSVIKIGANLYHMDYYSYWVRLKSNDQDSYFRLSRVYQSDCADDPLVSDLQYLSIQSRVDFSGFRGDDYRIYPDGQIKTRSENEFENVPYDDELYHHVRQLTLSIIEELESRSSE